MNNNLKVLYEDNHLIVVVKPTNVLSQEDHTKDLDMLTMVKSYIKEKYNKPGNVYVGLVHRLDRMTSGIMVFAKTSKGASRLSDQIRQNQMEKKYFAIVEGITPVTGTLVNYLYKDEELVKSFVTNDKNKGKRAELQFETQKAGKNRSLVNVSLITGRHHQIRVQFAHSGHPLVGDTLYGAKTNGLIRLHAYYLSFYHPVTKEKLEFYENPLWKEEVF